MADIGNTGRKHAVQNAAVGRGRWSADELRDTLQEYVKEKFQNEKAVLVVDETGILKQGKMSAGVQRQYSGTAGRIENCQIGVFMNYAVNDKFCCIDRELYIPKQWTEDKERCRKAGIPEKYQFRTNTQMALEMIKRAYENGIPFEWVTGDSVYGADREYRSILKKKIRNIYLQYQEKSISGLDSDNI